MCYHPYCASGVRCAALLRKGLGGRRTLHCFSPSRDHWASPPGKCKKSPRGALTLEMCQPVCAFVDGKHCLQTCFLLCKMRIQTLPGIFFLCLTNWLKNSTSWWRGHNHVTQTGETGEVEKLKLLLSHPHLSAGFVLNEGSLFLQVGVPSKPPCQPGAPAVST